MTKHSGSGLSCFLLYDFAYYWKHRLGHEVALFWGSHVAHHQSEDFNLSTALRQTSIDFYGFLFYLPFFFLRVFQRKFYLPS